MAIERLLHTCYKFSYGLCVLKANPVLLRQIPLKGGNSTLTVLLVVALVFAFALYFHCCHAKYQRATQNFAFVELEKASDYFPPQLR